MRNIKKCIKTFINELFKKNKKNKYFDNFFNFL